MSSPSHSLLAAAAGITSCTIFFAMNTTLNYIALPCYLLPLTPRFKPKRGTDDNNEPEAATDLIFRQWETTYSTGHMIGPGSCIFSTLAYLYAAQTSPSENFNLKGWYYFAAACVATAFPFTVLCILPTNDELYRRAESLKPQAKTQNLESEKPKTAETEISQGKGRGKGKSEFKGVETLTLIRKCLFLSKIRALTPLPAIVVALYAIAKTG